MSIALLFFILSTVAQCLPRSRSLQNPAELGQKQEDLVDVHTGAVQVGKAGESESLVAVSAELARLREQLAAYERHTFKDEFAAACAAEDQTNLCVDGKLVPELYVLGALKTSSTLLYDNFRTSPSVVAYKCHETDEAFGEPECEGENLGKYWKEPHFFSSPSDMAGGKSWWLEHWPECPQSERMVAMDMSVSYLMAPESVIPTLQLFYGGSVSQIKFVVLMREPLEAMQSLFYFGKSWATSNTGDFKKWVRDVMSGTGDERDRGCWQNAMYVQNIQDYFNQINPSQFMVVPMKYNTEYNKGTAPLHEYLWQKFGLQYAPSRASIEETSNVNKHPSIEQDLGDQLKSEFETFVYSITGPDMLADLFVGSDAQLYGNKAGETDKSQIAAWIRNGW